MRLTRVQFTLRRLMVAVAVLAVLFGLIAWDLRLQMLSSAYRKQAWRIGRIEETNRLAEKSLRERADADILVAAATDKAMAEFESAGAPKLELRGKADILRGRASKERESAARKAKLGDHYGSLKEKYEDAARYPWRPVAPDPPEPK